ncbi:MAG: hypothetical protein VB814_07605, partial [Pirellulaceae bacterium]
PRLVATGNAVDKHDVAIKSRRLNKDTIFLLSGGSTIFWSVFGNIYHPTSYTIANSEIKPLTI